jgi:predicted RNA-binding Zn ribbon-like protein
MDVATTRYYFLAGNLCLDYANTADWHEAEQPVEMLTSYGDLLTWGRQAGILDSGAAGLLLRAAEYQPEAAVAAYERSIALRETIFRIFRLMARHETPSASDLALLNHELVRASRHRQVVTTSDGYDWGWADQDAALDFVLWHVAQSAAELLVEGERERIRQCAGDPCGWLFYDTSRNRSRRWCNMEGCGNRAKARRYYERRRIQQ